MHVGDERMDSVGDDAYLAGEVIAVVCYGSVSTCGRGDAIGEFAGVGCDHFVMVL